MKKDVQEELIQLTDTYCTVLEHVTGGRMSKPYLDASIVISVCDDHYNESIEPYIVALEKAKDCINKLALKIEDESLLKQAHKCIDYIDYQL